MSTTKPKPGPYTYPAVSAAHCDACLDLTVATDWTRAVRCEYHDLVALLSCARQQLELDVASAARGEGEALGAAMCRRLIRSLERKIFNLEGK